MKTVTTREAQHHLSKVLEMVDRGEEVIITRRGEQVAKLSPIKKEENVEVDWSACVQELEQHLQEMPDVGESIVMRERESYHC